MLKFLEISSVAATFPDINIDTDAIIPKQFLKTIERSGLGKNLFYDQRYDKNKNENKNFILNIKPWRNAKIIIAGDNFGCGSSREHAPWALLDFGIRCIISSSFADIFYNNSIKNGLFPLVLKKEEIIKLMRSAKNKETIKVNLLEKKVYSLNSTFSFKLENSLRERLLNGYDDIGVTFKNIQYINDYEKREFKEKKWKLLDNDKKI